MEELLSAIRHGKPWLDSFTRYAYREAFGQYRQEFARRYMAAAQTADSVESLARELVDGIENGWKAERFWNRAAARADDKMMLVAYLTPMLLASGEKCAALAREICRAWNERFPDRTYETADYDKILNGFRHSVLGIDMESKHIGRK